MVSLIIPCHNYARFLPEAVASIVAQSYHDWELIIVDDGSSDDTAAVAEALRPSLQGHALTLIQQPQRGVSAARNRGAAQAQGRYLVFLDADDMLLPEMLRRCCAVLDADPALGFVYGGMRLFGDDDHTWPSLAFDRRLLALDNFVPPHTLVRRAAWQAVGGFDQALSFGEDWDFWLRVSARWPGRYLPQTLVAYRRHGAGASNLSSARIWDARASIMRKHPDLYGPRLRWWATRRLAHQQSRHEKAATRPAAASNQHAARVSGRALIRRIPFSLRIRARHALRRAQFLLLASGLAG